MSHGVSLHAKVHLHLVHYMVSIFDLRVRSLVFIYFLHLKQAPSWRPAILLSDMRSSHQRFCSKLVFLWKWSNTECDCTCLGFSALNSCQSTSNYIGCAWLSTLMSKCAHNLLNREFQVTISLLSQKSAPLTSTCAPDTAYNENIAFVEITALNETWPCRSR